jgi:oxygen-dependent protoporphyrinogen oxidase
VVGGGLAGLTAAWFLAEAGHRVTVLEGSPLVGGKLRTAEVAGIQVDVGAESMLARRPEGLALVESLGLPVVHPATIASRVWSRGELRPLPRTLMGVPLDAEGLAASGLLSPDGLERALHEQTVPTPDGDVSVTELIAARLGGEVVERLVEPLLGGVYAGHASLLSARATLPQVVALLDRAPTLTEAAATLPAVDGPVFAGITGGLGTLPAALVHSGRFEVRTDAVVRELHRAATGWTMVVGSTRDAHEVAADHVVLATPAAPTARLLRTVAPTASAELMTIESASMAVVTFAFREVDVAGLEGSGFLVPPVDGRTIKASTFSFNKWDWVHEAGAGLCLLRTSIGRHREESTLQVDDDELVRSSLLDLAAATGLAALPVDTHVQRWGGGLPQYAVGHLDRVARIRTDVGMVSTLRDGSALASSGQARSTGGGRLAVCGAAYDGVGIPAVISSARRAADEIVAGE